MDYELTLFDRIEMIKTINKKYDLESNAYISFSGGKDSVCLHYLVDLSLPNNKIPRVFINTGIEYLDIARYVKELANKDSRFIIINPTQNIKFVLEKYGYPFKSKQHSHYLSIYQSSGVSQSVKRYLGTIESSTQILCPKFLRYQFTNDFKQKVSDRCCYKLKKEPATKWAKQNNKSIILTGMRKAEGGQRQSINCIVVKGNKLEKFHPLLVVSNEWEEEFIKRNNIKLCKLYYPPFNFKRTGCKGCPYSLDLQEQLDIMQDLLPSEYKQCEMLWQPIYDEYRRINYRLGPHQIKLF